MRKRLEVEERSAAPSKRQLRMAAAIHTALSDAWYKDGLCPVTKRGDGSPLVEITEVNLSMDLRHAVVRWTPAVSSSLGAYLFCFWGWWGDGVVSGGGGGGVCVYASAAFFALYILTCTRPSKYPTGLDGGSVSRGQEGAWRAAMRLRRRLVRVCVRLCCFVWSGCVSGMGRTCPSCRRLLFPRQPTHNTYTYTKQPPKKTDHGAAGPAGPGHAPPPLRVRAAAQGLSVGLCLCTCILGVCICDLSFWGGDSPM